MLNKRSTNIKTRVKTVGTVKIQNFILLKENVHISESKFAEILGSEMAPPGGDGNDLGLAE